MKEMSPTSNVLSEFHFGRLLGKGFSSRCYLVTKAFTKKEKYNVSRKNVVQEEKKFALKVVSLEYTGKCKKRTQLLQNEIEIHQSLSNQHIVRFESSFCDDSNIYILLELCHNNSLSQMLHRRKALTDFEVKYYISQLVDALLYLYESKVIHRDLKLANIFLDKQMRIKVGDFGLSTKLKNRNDCRYTVSGTPNYIAPEIISSKGYGFEVDIWSLGVITYTLLIGKPPYETENVKKTYSKIRKNDYSFPSSKDTPPVSFLAKNFIQSLLQLSPKDRPLPHAIKMNPFLSKNRETIPTFLPNSAINSPPLEFIKSCECQISKKIF